MVRVICGSHHDHARRLLNSIPLLSKDRPCSEVAFMVAVFAAKNVIDLVHEDNSWSLCWALLEPPELCSQRKDGSDYFLCLAILLVPQQVSGDVQEETLVLPSHYLQTSVSHVTQKSNTRVAHDWQNT